MRHYRAGSPYLVVVLLLLAMAAPTTQAAAWRAGAASVDITPPTGFALWGYGARHDTPSDGVLDPLQARALVLEAGGHRLALVSLDLGRAPTRQSLAAIRERVKPAGVEHLFLVASHTHNGPVIELDNWPNPRTSYVRQLEQKLADVILQACKQLRPARLGVASRELRLNRNRHSRRDDRPIDRELLVLRVEDEEGMPIAHAINFAAHPTMHPSQLHKFSADFPGALATHVEKETGAPCLFLQGAAGDLSADPPRERSPEVFGRHLGGVVLETARGIRCADSGEPSLQAVEEEFRFASRIDLGNPLIKGLFVAAFFRELVDFYQAEYREGLRPRMTVALLGGRIGLVGVSGEFFCGHALSLKRRARLDHVFFLGYCNDYQQYFPTIEAAAEGGYGTDPSTSPAEVGAGERMMDRALVHLYQMQGRLPGGK